MIANTTNWEIAKEHVKAWFQETHPTVAAHIKGWSYEEVEWWGNLIADDGMFFGIRDGQVGFWEEV